MQGQETRHEQARGASHPVNMAEIAVRGTALLFDIQMEAARSLLQIQARSVAALGAPDYSDLFRLGDDRAKRLFETSAEQLLNSARQATDTVSEMQRQFGRIVEQQTIVITQDMRNGMEELGRRTQESLQEVKQLAQREAEEMQRMTQEASRQPRSNGEHQPAGQVQPPPERQESDEKTGRGRRM